MNCPSRTDETVDHPDWNQNPGPLAGDLTTREDLNGISNLRSQRSHVLPGGQSLDAETEDDPGIKNPPPSQVPKNDAKRGQNKLSNGPDSSGLPVQKPHSSLPKRFRRCIPHAQSLGYFFGGILKVFSKYTTFVGPGFMVAVAYIDPGNYATDVAAGASTRFQLLFIVLMSNIFAVILQSLAIRLGTVTGLNLAEHCRANLPMWLNIVLYILAEAAIIATDIAEVSFARKVRLASSYGLGLTWSR